MMRGTFLCRFPNATGSKFGKRVLVPFTSRSERGLVKLGELEKLDASDISDKSDRVRQVRQSQTSLAESDKSDGVGQSQTGQKGPFFGEGMSLQ